jgi:UDP:flavonoid glycosyltransferase YjiC (YdhE family)
MIFREKYIPHDWLFPQVSCAVHHGGIGTTTMQLKAGVPGVIVPFNFDQPFWGGVLSRLGAAPAPIPFRQLTSERLAQAIHTCLDSEDMRQKAARIADQVRKERGVETSIAIMHRYMEEFRKKQ